MSIFDSKLLPYESTILEKVSGALPNGIRGQYIQQLACINKVQRLLNWNEIEFYCMHLLKVRWPEKVMFQDKEEFILGSGELLAKSLSAEISVWAVGGHVFSIESTTPLKPFRSIPNATFTLGHLY